MCEVYFIGEENKGSCYLVKGSHAVVFDPGMAYEADQTIEKVKEVLGEQPVEAIFLTHSHFDHAAAVPYFRQIWPDVKVYAAAYAQKIFAKPSARETMLELTNAGVKKQGICWDASGYNTDLLYVDEIMADNDLVTIGDLHIRAIETIGHTKCSLSYIVNEKILIAAETIGLLHGGYLYMPQFLVDYDKSYESIGKLRALNVDRLCTSHCGILEQPDEAVWQRFEDGLVKTREVITEILQKYASEEDRMDAMREVFWKPELKMKTARTLEAFDMNAQAMLKTIERVMREEQ